MPTAGATAARGQLSINTPANKPSTVWWEYEYGEMETPYWVFRTKELQSEHLYFEFRL